jgi:hypothetical protein
MELTHHLSRSYAAAEMGNTAVNHLTRYSDYGSVTHTLAGYLYHELLLRLSSTLRL